MTFECRGEPAGLVRADPRHDRGEARRQRPGLVQHQGAGDREPLENVAALDQDARASGAADRGRDRERGREPERARARHDEQRDGVIDRERRVEKRPQDRGRRGQDQDHGDEPCGQPVGGENDRCTAPGGLLDEMHQSTDAGVLARASNLDRESRGQVGRTGVHGIAHGHRNRAGFAGQERAIEVGGALDDRAVDRNRIARANLDPHAGRERLDRDLPDRFTVDQPGRRRRQGMEQFGGVGRLALLTTLDPTPGQQEQDQRGHRVEVQFAADDDVPRAPRRAGEDAERDGNVHVQRAHAKRRERSAVEQRRRPQHRGQRDRERPPPEQHRERRIHAVKGAAVERERHQHDVGRREPGDSDPDQEIAVLPAAHVAHAHATKRMNRVPERVEEPGDRRQRRRRRIPGDARHRALKIEPDLRHSRDRERGLLDQPHARCAVNPLEIEFGRERSVAGRPDVQFAKRRIVELAVATPRDPRGLVFAHLPAADAVVAFEAMGMDDVPHDLAAVATELPLGVLANESSRNREAAVIAGNVVDRGRIARGGHGTGTVGTGMPSGCIGHDSAAGSDGAPGAPAMAGAARPTSARRPTTISATLVTTGR